MLQNVEIEFKNLLCKKEYELLLDYFSIQPNDIFTQENHYFDTSDFLLKQNHAALRIRQKGTQWELTLKQPHKEGLLETNEILSPQAAELAISENNLPTGHVQKLIDRMGVPFTKLEYFGSLVTKRTEVKREGGLFVLDFNSYLNKNDYELECEVDNYLHGRILFEEFLADHGIPKRHTKNKVQRFYERKYSMMDS